MARKLLQRILGGKKTKSGYIKRTNAEIYECYRKPQIDMVIKSRRLQWLGHTERMARNRTVRRIAWKAPGYKKKRGRPRRRWRGAVLEDLEDEGIVDWKAKAMHRGK